MDDVRPAPEGWELARSVEAALRWVGGLGSTVPYAISLDYDMGMTTEYCATCNNRGFGYLYQTEHPDYCNDCSHVILSDDAEALNGLEFLVRICELQDKVPRVKFLPSLIYIHSANPIGRNRMQWYIRDMQKKYDREWPEAFR